jgi:hypothetical protein
MAAPGLTLRRRALLILLLLCLAGASRNSAQVPFPQPKPDTNAQKQPAGTPAPPTSTSTGTKPSSAPATSMTHPGILFSMMAIPRVDYEKCVAELTTAGAEIEQPFHVEQQGCVLDGAVVLRSVMTITGKVGISSGPTLMCPFALTFSRWVKEVSAPIIVQQMGAPLAVIQTGTAFLCRNRVGLGESKVSEHARGNALDIVSFDLRDRTRIIIGDEVPPASPIAKTLRGLRTSACGYFTTVLGPGSNEAHKTHFHFDLGQHGKSGSYRICE